MTKNRLHRLTSTCRRWCRRWEQEALLFLTKTARGTTWLCLDPTGPELYYTSTYTISSNHCLRALRSPASLVSNRRITLGMACSHLTWMRSYGRSHAPDRNEGIISAADKAVFDVTRY